MKTLLLADETFKLMLSALSITDEGREVLARFNSKPKLPPDRELIAMARRGDEAPSAVARAVERRDAGRRAASDTREDLKALLLELHAAGVPPYVLQAWFGYPPSQMFAILAGAQTTQEPATV